MPLRRILSDWGIPVGLACMVVAFAVGSAANPDIKRIGHDVRWVALVVLCAAAVFEALRRLWPTRSLPAPGLLRFAVLAGAFLALAVISTAWSVAPRLTFERAASLGFLFVLAAALASLTARDTIARLRLFQGLAAGAIAVAFLGLVVAVVDYDTAVQQASASSPWRYRGFTENPNTIAILAAATLPIVVALAIRSRSGRGRAAWLTGALLLLGSILASGSRGGELAACAGTLVVAVLGVEGLKYRVAAVSALVLVFGGGIALRQAVQPPAPGFTSKVAAAPIPASAGPATPSKGAGKSKGQSSGSPRSTGGKSTGGTGTGKQRPKKAAEKPTVVPKKTMQQLPNEQDEIGHPALSKVATTTLASGRIAAWEGALEQIEDRPLLGYGFGTEQKVFVDRWYFFQGGTAENSYLGLLLQLGGVGLALFLAIGCALAVGGWRALRFVDGDDRVLTVASLGVLVAAAVIMLIQSYVYSVGNVATATVWISLFALSPLALEPRAATARVRATASEATS